MSPPGEVPVVEVRAVARTFAGSPPVHALRHVDLRVEEGEHVALVGRSGSGKSTLLAVLGLLDRPDTGTYRFDGQDTGSLPERARVRLRAGAIGFVFQGFHLLPRRTAVENVELGLLYGPPRHPRERRRLAVDALASVGLGHRLAAVPSTMSGGEQQRTAIARAIVGAPRLLLCDEPTGNLDAATAGEVLDLLGSLHRRGLTLLVVTHDAEVTARADRVVTLHDGATAGHGVAAAVP